MQDDPLKLKVDGVTSEKLELSLCSTSKNSALDLDFCSVGVFEKQLLGIMSVYKSRLPACIMLSLRPVRFIDSEGLLFCMQMHTLFQEKGCWLVFSDVHLDVLRLFKMTGMDRNMVEVSGIEPLSKITCP